jgi:hypothetical protein
MITVDFLKGKNEAVGKVKDYLTHLRVHGKTPKYIRVDRGKEFINNPLQVWCGQQGIDIQKTAPYSPSQSGVAEQANRTLVKLAQAMIRGCDMPEFLWELAVTQAAYVRNRAYTQTLKEKTLYETWFRRKPDVTNLYKFGCPVWVLLQGQHIEQKLLPKSKKRSYVRFDDGSKSIKYYNVETRKILTSCNYCVLKVSEPQPPDDIVVALPDVPFKGELGETEQSIDIEDTGYKKQMEDVTIEETQDAANKSGKDKTGIQEQPNKRKEAKPVERKRKREEELTEAEPHQTCG